ncbi:MAG: T9SS type A sorting domain-containing protein [Cyclobacteriaceae bacterium]|nr:T9SS type A sorting domain-containing protein [Cyclobacteriaceae bacterium]
MKKVLWLASFTLMGFSLAAQTFEITGLQDSYRGQIGETIKAPVRFKNTSEKSVTLIIRKVNSEIGVTQKNFFCIDGNCLDQKIEDYIVKVEPGQTLMSFQVALEGGLVSGVSTVRYLAYNKSNPNEAHEFEINFAIEEKPDKQSIYTSRNISIQDVYPNPVTDYAFVNYKILNDKAKAKIVIHNILGNPLDEYELPVYETRVKITSDKLNAGIYFYTLYVDNEGVMTRKLIIKK